MNGFFYKELLEAGASIYVKKSANYYRDKVVRNMWNVYFWVDDAMHIYVQIKF
jgi:hypothetical protein